MKILTKQEQLKLKSDELNSAIDLLQHEVDTAFKRKQTKTNWGILSFIVDEYWLLDFKYKTKSNQLKLMEEYRNLINEMLYQENNFLTIKK